MKDDEFITAGSQRGGGCVLRASDRFAGVPRRLHARRIGAEAALWAPSSRERIVAYIVKLKSRTIHPVLLLDKSYLLRQQVLDHLHILTNCAWDSSALLSLVLIGLPEINAQLPLNRSRSLWSRIHTRLHTNDHQLP